MTIRQRLTEFHVSLGMAFDWTLKLLAVLGVISLGIVIYALYFEPPFLRYQNLPFPVATPVEQGRTVPIVIERCNDSKKERVYMSARTLRNVETGREVQLPESTVSIKPGCDRMLSRAVVIPLETPPGKYIIDGEGIAQGLLRKHGVDWYTEQFDVIPIQPITKELAKENKADQTGATP